jgi:hypothetical protein
MSWIPKWKIKGITTRWMTGVDIQGGYDNGSNTLIVLISLLKRIDDEGYL